MDKITGRFASASVFATNVEDYAKTQIMTILDNEVSKESKVCIMPDCHPGKLGPIGLAMTIHKRTIPHLLGVDIGCGMLVTKVEGRLEYQKLDKVIRENIPSGFGIRKKPHHMADSEMLSELRCCHDKFRDNAMLSLGTLGGGNHFIEVDKGEDGFYVVIHSGSRHLGVNVTEYYTLQGGIASYQKGENIPHILSYVEGDLMADYLHDVEIVTAYASLNREVILHEILKGMKWWEVERFESVHNYIGVLPDGKRILRKGAASALEGEPVVIPVNMRDGVILGVGKGNPEWNYSAPHGSGRVMRRVDVKNHYTVSAFKNDMKGIYSSSIGPGTLDEAPIAYRGINEILEAISGNVEVRQVLKPVYNFKAGKEG